MNARDAEARGWQAANQALMGILAPVATLRATENEETLRAFLKGMEYRIRTTLDSIVLEIENSSIRQEKAS